MTALLARGPHVQVAAAARSAAAKAWAAVAAAGVGVVALVAPLVHARGRGAAIAPSVAVAVLAACWLAAAVEHTWRDDREPLGVLLWVAASVGVVGFVARTWLLAGPATAGGALDVVADAAACLGAAVLFHLAVGLPSGRLGSSVRRAAVAVGHVAALGVFVALSVVGDAGWIRYLTIAAAAVGIAGGGWAMFTRYPVAGIRGRHRMQWFATAAGLVAVWSVVVATSQLLFAWPRPVGILEVLAAALLPLALATERSDLATRRSEWLAVRTFHMAIWVALVCGMLVLFVPGLVHRPRGDQRGLVAATIVALLVTAALVPVIRPWLADLADRLVHGDRHPADDALRVLTRRRGRPARLDDLLADVVDALGLGLGAASVELWQRVAPGEFECTVANPSGARPSLRVPETTQWALSGRGMAGPDATALWLPELPDAPSDRRFRVVPVAYAGELLALLVARRGPGTDDFSDEDQSILAEVARQLALVLHNAHLDSTLTRTLEELHAQAVELRASRARVVAAADAGRRRIERDLHDGAQQQLVALAVSLGVLREVVRSDPDDALVIVDELRSEVQTAIDDMRALAHGIYPPLLASRGLTEAIAAVARRRGDGSATFRSEGIERYAPEIEAAVYFCCLEALQNAAKHASGSPVEVALTVVDGSLHFVIADRGPGFATDVESSGQGRINMADRIGAVGGMLEWRNAPEGGAVVAGSVPIR